MLYCLIVVSLVALSAMSKYLPPWGFQKSEHSTVLLTQHTYSTSNLRGASFVLKAYRIVPLIRYTPHIKDIRYKKIRSLRTSHKGHGAAPQPLGAPTFRKTSSGQKPHARWFGRNTNDKREAINLRCSVAAASPCNKRLPRLTL